MACLAKNAPKAESWRHSNTAEIIQKNASKFKNEDSRTQQHATVIIPGLWETEMGSNNLQTVFESGLVRKDSCCSECQICKNFFWQNSGKIKTLPAHNSFHILQQMCFKKYNVCHMRPTIAVKIGEAWHTVSAGTVILVPKTLSEFLGDKERG